MEYLRKNAPSIFVAANKNSLLNTAQEIRHAKQYMLTHHYKSAIIVSDPPVTRRVKMLTDIIKVKNDENLFLILADTCR